jgi:hypothetical protein
MDIKKQLMIMKSVAAGEAPRIEKATAERHNNNVSTLEFEQSHLPATIARQYHDGWAAKIPANDEKSQPKSQRIDPAQIFANLDSFFMELMAL